MKDKWKRSARPDVPDPLIRTLRDSGQLLGLMAQITGLSKAEVIEQLRREEASLGRSVRDELDRRGIEPYVWSNALAKFYMETDAFLFESVVWNLTRYKNRMRRWIAAFVLREFGRPATVLVYGDGLGFDSYYLALAGHQVSSFEVSQNGVEFAQSVLSRDGIDVRIPPVSPFS